MRQDDAAEELEARHAVQHLDRRGRYESADTPGQQARSCGKDRAGSWQSAETAAAGDRRRKALGAAAPFLVAPRLMAQWFQAADEQAVRQRQQAEGGSRGGLGSPQGSFQAAGRRHGSKQAAGEQRESGMRADEGQRQHDRPRWPPTSRPARHLSSPMLAPCATTSCMMVTRLDVAATVVTALLLGAAAASASQLDPHLADRGVTSWFEGAWPQKMGRALGWGALKVASSTPLPLPLAARTACLPPPATHPTCRSPPACLLFSPRLQRSPPIPAGWYIRLMPTDGSGDAPASLSLIVAVQPNAPPEWGGAMASLTIQSSRQGGGRGGGQH